MTSRWLKPILSASELRSQVRRGRVIARKGWVDRLTVRPGLITAEVKNDTGGISSVKLRQGAIDDRAWDEVIQAMAEEAGRAARLLGGNLSPDMLGTFDDAGVDLFPFDVRDITNFCSCREDTNVCTHAVATHFAVADAIAADPFVLFEFRGRARDNLIEQLKDLRSVSLSGADSDGEPEQTEPAAAVKDGYWDRGVVPTFAFRFGTTSLRGEDGFPVIRALGPGPSDIPPETVADVLAPLARVARSRLDVVVEPMPEEESTDAPDPFESMDLGDLLVAAAHQHGTLSSGFVAEALDVTVQQARRYLQWLVQEGRLDVRGRARATRYVIPGTEPD